jgi:hypothetical protein
LGGGNKEKTMTTYGTAAWKGGLKYGKGAISTKSCALKE